MIISSTISQTIEMIFDISIKRYFKNIKLKYVIEKSFFHR